MSVISEQGILPRSYISNDTLVLEPIKHQSSSLPFLKSQLINPELFKAGILQLNQVVMAHPGLDLNMIYDPVVTVTENHIDFEAFARFGHSYCKIRFPETLFKDPIREEGKTNVDFNPKFIRDLRNSRYTRNLWLSIDRNGVDVEIERHVYKLKKITMPKWWNNAYRELKPFLDLEVMEPRYWDEAFENYEKVILSGMAFQNLVQQVENSYFDRDDTLHSLLWNTKTVHLMLGGRDGVCGTPVNLLKPISKSIRQWGVWRIQNLSEIARHVIQADVYIADKNPSFWHLHVRSGVEVFLAFTPYISSLWTEAAKQEIEALLINPNKFSRSRIPRQREKISRQKRRKKVRVNIVEMYPGQRTILDCLSHNMS